MTPAEKFREIARGLLEKTKAKQVNWTRGAAVDPGFPITNYEVAVAESRIVLSYGRPRAEPDFLALRLQNADGTLDDPWLVDDPELPGAPTDDWLLLQSLYNEAHRAVTGWEKVIRDVDNALASQGPIGKPARP